MKDSKIQFYKHNKVGFLLRILTLDDVAFWGASSLVSVIFALFIVANIQGASAVNVGIALTLQEIIKAILSIPIGKMFDRQKGFIDEIYFLSLSGFLVGLLYILLSFAATIPQLYLIMLFIGVSHAINLNAWRILFYGSIKNSERGETTGIYQTIFSVSGALILALSGFIADQYGFNVVLILGGVMSIIGGFLPLLLRGSVKKNAH